MKSLAFNAVILYILFKSSFRDHILSRLPEFLSNGTSLPQLCETLSKFLHKSCRLSRRSIACMLFVIGIWIAQKIWQRLRGSEWLGQFVERYIVASASTGANLSPSYMGRTNKKTTNMKKKLDTPTSGGLPA